MRSVMSRVSEREKVDAGFAACGDEEELYRAEARRALRRDMSSVLLRPTEPSSWLNERRGRRGSVRCVWSACCVSLLKTSDTGVSVGG
jgi:hypothetical protein